MIFKSTSQKFKSSSAGEVSQNGLNSYIKYYVRRQDKPFMTLSFPNIMLSAARPAIRKSSLARTWSLLELTMSECPSGNSLVYRDKTLTINKPPIKSSEVKTKNKQTTSTKIKHSQSTLTENLNKSIEV